MLVLFNMMNFEVTDDLGGQPTLKNQEALEYGLSDQAADSPSLLKLNSDAIRCFFASGYFALKTGILLFGRSGW